jgi:hypothetical protein
MQQQVEADRKGANKTPKIKTEREINPIRRSNPNSPAVSSFGKGDGLTGPNVAARSAAQTTGTIFTGVIGGGGAGSSSPYVPPDTMGAIGPTQYVVSVNGRIRSFTRAGVADGVLDADQDVFFNSVRTDGISDPLISYDRLTGRWFATAIDVADPNNRVVIGVTDGPTITPISGWSFYYFQQNIPTPAGDDGCFFDYPTTGVDANALIIGGNQFCGFGYSGGAVFVVQKASLLSGGPIVVTAFRQLTQGYPNVGAGNIGIVTPRGMNSWDAGNPNSYFFGDDNSRFGLLNFYRINNAGSLTPTLIGPIEITVPQTSNPIPVNHLGNSNPGGTFNGRVDAIDPRIYPAYIREGKVWLAHNVSVNASGVAQGSTNGDRNAVRWYQFDSLDTTPALLQSGTIFDNAGTNPLNYFFGTAAVTGQGHVVFGFTSGGTAQYLGAAWTGRLATDAAGSTSAPQLYKAGNGAYNPFDSGTSRARRWGDYTQTVVDPCDDMTVWTAQEYTHTGSATNGAQWGISVAQIKAPPPATLSSASPNSVQSGQFSLNVTLTGTSSNGSGFFDTPNTNTDPCRKRLAVTVSNGVYVNSVTYVNPTTITVNITTFGATTGMATVTVTNPDDQQSAAAVLEITPGTPNATPTATYTPSPTSTVTATYTPSATFTPSPTPVVYSCPGTLTASSPKFNRPEEGNPPTTLNSGGVNFYYNAMPFTVSATGTYTMTPSTMTIGSGEDGFYVLYSPTFNPATPLASALVSNDDGGAGLTPSITRSLTAGTDYILVTTTYSQNATGSFTNTIFGPGSVNWCSGGATATPTMTASPTLTPIPPRPDTVGLYKDGTFYLRNSNTSGIADITANFGGDVSDIPVAGDWNGDSVDTIGIYRQSTGALFLSNSNTTPSVAYNFIFGNPNDIAFGGKWHTVAAHDGIGVFRPSNGILYLRNDLTTGFADYFMIFGNPSDRGMSGDWNNDGVDTVGIYRTANTRWYMSNANGNGITYSDVDFEWNILTHAAMSGDWNADGITTVGYYDPTGAVFVLHGSLATVGADSYVWFGPGGGMPMRGKWTAPAGPSVGIGVIGGVGGSPVEGGSDGAD